MLDASVMLYFNLKLRTKEWIKGHVKHIFPISPPTFSSFSLMCFCQSVCPPSVCLPVLLVFCFVHAICNFKHQDLRLFFLWMLFVGISEINAVMSGQ